MLKNTKSQYGLAFKVFHWILACGCISLFFLGVYMVTLSYYHPLYHDTLHWHKSIGMLMALLWLAQMLWWPINPPPSLDQATVPWQKFLARLVHALLLLTILVLSITGYLIATSTGDAVDVWNWFSVISVYETGEPFLSYLGIIHAWAAYTMAGAVVLHVAGVIWHLWHGDNILRRMIF